MRFNPRHVLVGQLDAYDDLREAQDHYPHFCSWIVPKPSKKGDTVLLLIGKEFVGEAVIRADAKPSKVSGEYLSTIGAVKLWKPGVLVEDIAKKLPQWKYLTYTRRYASVPDDVQTDLREAINSALEDSDDDPRRDNWSRAELVASVEAYVEMLRGHLSGERVIKKAVYEELAERFGRTPKAFEFRMQNISYVYSVMGRQWLPGLKPASHVGTGVASLLESLIAEVEGVDLVPVVGFETEVKELQKKAVRQKSTTKPLAEPKGSEHPATSRATVTQYIRIPDVKAWVLIQANGVCECCGMPAPFLGSDGLPFLEVHHVRHLADGGPDTIENAVAICPNCHRELHYGVKSSDLVDSLYAKVSRLTRR